MVDVTALESYAVADDGKTVEFRFKTASGTRALTFQAQTLGAVAVDFVHAVDEAAKRSNLAKRGVIQATTPKRWRVGVLDDDESILLSFEMPNTAVIDYAFFAIDAGRLGAELVEKAAKARNSNPKLRQ